MRLGQSNDYVTIIEELYIYIYTYFLVIFCNPPPPPPPSLLLCDFICHLFMMGKNELKRAAAKRVADV